MLSERGSATDPKRPTEVLPLEGVRVLEIAGLEAVQYAGRVLAVLGASVTKVEPPEGDRLRRRPPFHRCQNGGERSVPFEFFNAGKQSVVFDPVMNTIRNRGQASSARRPTSFWRTPNTANCS